jgi:hypothetical protein
MSTLMRIRRHFSNKRSGDGLHSLVGTPHSRAPTSRARLGRLPDSACGHR